WFCHFDDDNYVNVPRLLKLLDNYNPREDWYLGRPSIPAPLEIIRQGPEPFKRPSGKRDSLHGKIAGRERYLARGRKPFRGIKEDRREWGNCEEKYHPTRTRAGKLENKEFCRGIIGSVFVRLRKQRVEKAGRRNSAANFLAGVGKEASYVATLRSYRIYASRRKLVRQYFSVCELKLNPRLLPPLGAGGGQENDAWPGGPERKKKKEKEKIPRCIYYPLRQINSGFDPSVAATITLRDIAFLPGDVLEKEKRPRFVVRGTRKLGLIHISREQPIHRLIGLRNESDLADRISDDGWQNGNEIETGSPEMRR
ncbi:hypothetical protein K0M31_006173, partial [Melipona bicolor]